MGSNPSAQNVTRSPVILGISLAVLGSLTWFILERWATALGAGSPQPGFDGVFVALLLVQVCYYIIAVPRIRRAGQTCLEELSPLLDQSNPQVSAITSGFYDKRLPGVAWAFIVGGCITVLLQEAQFQRFSLWLDAPDLALGEIWTVITAWFTWTLGLASAALLVRHAAGMKQLGRHWIDVDLMRIGQLAAFSRYGLQLAGLVIGLIAIWAASIVLVTSMQGNQWNETSGYVGSLMASSYIALSVIVFVYPQLGIRQRIREEKGRVYSELTQMLPHSTHAVAQADSNPERLAALLSSRTQIQALPEWPAGQHMRLQLGAYMMMPLMSWTAAAFVEQIVTWLIG